MRSMVCFLASAALLAGCATNNAGHAQAKPDEKPKKVAVTENPILVGTVITVKTNLACAVLNFPVGSVPGSGRQLNVYRHGLKVGEVKVTGPQQDDNTVGDITTGEIQPGDEIRND